MPSPKTRFGALVLAIASLPLQSLATSVDSYDYIIVGAGTSGLLLANRLTEDVNINVAVIDPGADERNNENVVNPLTWLGLSGTSVDWKYSSVPQENIGGRVLAYTAGRGIGGTSLINGMTYIRGDRAQFDVWKKLGNPGWDWDTMLQYYKKVERFIPPLPWQEAAGALYEEKYHGASGELHVGFSPVLLNGSFYRDAKETWAALGQDLNKDVNSGSTTGFDVWPQTLDPVKNVRCDSATAFYWPAQNRPNLRLINGTVSRILWKSGKSKEREASGVEFVSPNGRRKTVSAREEVILSAGALRTPLILELSGVGNPKILEKSGIKTVVNSPGVGENLIDQPNTVLSYSAKESFPGYAPYATFVNATSLFGDKVDSIAASTGENLPRWAQQISRETGGAISAKAFEHLLRIQHFLIFHKDITIAETLSTASGSSVFSAYWGTLPFSRGSVHLSSADDINTPAINPRFMSIDFDMAVQVATGRLSAKFWSTQPISAIVEAEIQPNSTTLPPGATDDQWESFTASNLASNSHPIGTAAMMSRELGGVVDSQLRVYGTKNVRVVDASVLPMQISGHLTATLYAVAERAAEFIQKEHLKKSKDACEADKL
ncbi:GMC oxidoreductase [Trichoderma barbatum]